MVRQGRAFYVPFHCDYRVLSDVLNDVNFTKFTQVFICPQNANKPRKWNYFMANKTINQLIKIEERICLRFSASKWHVRTKAISTLMCDFVNFHQVCKSRIHPQNDVNVEPWFPSDVDRIQFGCANKFRMKVSFRYKCTMCYWNVPSRERNAQFCLVNC